MAVSSLVAASGGVTMKVQEFTSTGSFTVPSNCSSVTVFAVGGGGGGGHFNTNGAAPPGAGGGGGGGEVVKMDIAVTPGSSYTVTIGAGGAGGNAASAGVGGDTTFGSLLTAKGGGSGAGWQNTAATLFPGTSRGTGGGGSGKSNSNTAWWGGSGGGAGGNAYLSSFQIGVGSSVDGLGGGTIFGGYQILMYSTNTHQAYSSGRGGHGLTVGKGNTAGTLPDYTSSLNLNTFIFAGAGIDGYGCGGPGGAYYGTMATSPSFSQGVLAVGSTGGNVNGNAGGANTGNGGGGASAYNASANGGAGGSGYMRITYWS